MDKMSIYTGSYKQPLLVDDDAIIYKDFYFEKKHIFWPMVHSYLPSI